MSARVRVFRGVVIRRVVTTQRPATRLTCPQMDPLSADLHALFALPTLRMFNGSNRRYVRASFLNHHLLLLLVEHLVYEGDRNRSFTDG
jgi:hypothetical protein